MAAGFISKPLSTLLSTAARWVEFGDASTAPVHLALAGDPATGLPVPAGPTEVFGVDAEPFSASRSTPGDFFIVDLKGHKSFDFQVFGTFTGADVRTETSENLISFIAVNAMALNSSPVSIWGSQIGAAGIYRVPRALRYLKVSLNAISTGTVEIIGHKSHEAILPALRSSDGNEAFHPHAIPTRWWNYAAASGGLVNTTPVTMRAANASFSNHLTSFTARNTHTSVDTELIVKTGSSVAWREKLKAGSAPAKFDGLIRSAVNEAITAECGTTGAEVYINAQGCFGR